MVQPSWISPIDINVTKPRLEEQNSLVPICKMIISIHYCCKNKIVWFLFAKWLLAFIIVIRYEVHDQYRDSMIKFYRVQCDWPWFGITSWSWYTRCTINLHSGSDPIEHDMVVENFNVKEITFLQLKKTLSKPRFSFSGRDRGFRNHGLKTQALDFE